MLHNSDNSPAMTEEDELARLRQENALLRQKLEQLETSGTDTEFQKQQQRIRELRADQIERIASPQFHTICKKLGMNDGDIQDVIYQMGGIASFIQLDDSGNPVVNVGGKAVSLLEGIPQLPPVQKRLRATPIAKLESEISSLKADIERQREFCRKSPDATMLAKLSVDKRRLQQLEQQLQSLREPGEPQQEQDEGEGAVDPKLLEEKEAIEAALKTEEPKWLRDRDNPKQFQKVLQLRKKRTAILKEIHRQLNQ